MSPFSAPTVDDCLVAWVAEQWLPNPCVGWTVALSATSAAMRCTEWYCFFASSIVMCGPMRSGRPTVPNSIEPPVKTPTSFPSASIST